MRNTQVEILQATKPLPNGRGRRRAGVQIDRIRVAAYCRVAVGEFCIPESLLRG